MIHHFLDDWVFFYLVFLQKPQSSANVIISLMTLLQLCAYKGTKYFYEESLFAAKQLQVNPLWIDFSENRNSTIYST